MHSVLVIFVDLMTNFCVQRYPNPTRTDRNSVEAGPEIQLYTSVGFYYYDKLMDSWRWSQVKVFSMRISQYLFKSADQRIVTPCDKKIPSYTWAGSAGAGSA